jgi:hypothetical protein
MMLCPKWFRCRVVHMECPHSVPHIADISCGHNCDRWNCEMKDRETRERGTACKQERDLKYKPDPEPMEN